MSQTSQMKVCVLDTETTGFDPKTGDRVVEIGVVEMINRRPTGRVFHTYLNPERSMPEEAFKVHGLSEKFLSDKPKFLDIAKEFVEFIADSVIVIHNAPFDLNFLNMELARAGFPSLDSLNIVVVDTLKVSQSQGRTKRHSLNVLCSFYGVENTNRKLHGALLDAQLLSEVYVCMTRDQGTLLNAGHFDDHDNDTETINDRALGAAKVIRVNVPQSDLDEHDQYLQQIEKESGGKPSVWRSLAIN